MNGMSQLAKNLLERHGIRRQVSSAMIVTSANELLDELLTNPAKSDVRAISFSEDILKIAVRHSAAAHVLSSMMDELENRLCKLYPDIHIKRIIHALEPRTFENFV